MEMLSDRGYEIPEDCIFCCTDESSPELRSQRKCSGFFSVDANSDDEKCSCYENFISWVGDDEILARKEMSYIFAKKKSLENKILIIWSFQCGIQDVQKINEKMDDEKVQRAIVVYCNKITPSGASSLKNLKNMGKLIEPFQESELQYNVTKSKWVPKHIICDKAKKDEILKQYNVPGSQIPSIKSTDPVIRYLGAAKGKMIKILRPSESIGYITIGQEKKQLFDIYYRIVVA